MKISFNNEKIDNEILIKYNHKLEQVESKMKELAKENYDLKEHISILAKVNNLDIP